MIPPVDMFGRFKNYLTENYEEIREAVLALYCEKPENFSPTQICESNFFEHEKINNKIKIKIYLYIIIKIYFFKL